MWHYYNLLDQSIQNLDRQDWFLVLCAVVLIGAFCMRGFGRQGY